VIAAHSVADGESLSDADNAGGDNGQPTSSQHGITSEFPAAAAADPTGVWAYKARQVGKWERLGTACGWHRWSLSDGAFVRRE